ncbi:FKBP-type peptidyl-prolyl cis-trans isomerase [Gordonia araii NBRC 100433]|uniref:Peptidyl-prolyl cis-trans isomerase n=1 Tax=Gordonia araii NBRC 100433 TaxID=1073574 RepID=G7GZK0_9ACTN|nr:FKBP-type peptidyl-prolyl cis-trans isomerase [Gordonia araii]NNG97906.1 peptidylprolyl isomerase [Gordonia araii NBRC 100433]GAB09025.1 FKBP-type peptidyl-prolyl cis-trans isomerase [Gordonia araii NBRC 100433]
MRKSALIAAVTLSAALVLAGCGSKDSTDDADDGAPEVGTCPTAAPAADAKTDWSLDGTSGSIKVVSPSKSHAPGVTVQGPFTVSETKVHTLREGSGDQTITEADMVSVCYMGVNGRDGNVFDSAYQRGAPASFPLTNVVTGFQKAIVGQKPGATVAVAMTPADGYGPMGGQPDAGIQAQDALIFVLQIRGIDKTDGSE